MASEADDTGRSTPSAGTSSSAPGAEARPTQRRRRSSESRHRARRRAARRRRRAVRLGLALVVLGIIAGYGAVQVVLAARAGHAAQRSLYLTGEFLGARQLDVARGHLADAEDRLDRADGHLRALGPLAWVARATPLVRVQMKALDNYREAGGLVIDAGERLLVAAEGVLEPPDDRLPVADALDALREVHRALHSGRRSLDDAAELVDELRGLRLFGPLAQLRDDFVAQATDIRRRAADADDGLDALIAFAGGDGPRRYLLLSQNPDEPRPTGGFFGSYGVLATDGTHLDLERYDGIEAWRPPLGEVTVPVEEAPTPFRVPTNPQPQRLRNANATADFPAGAELAMRLWDESGEAPVDGVVAFAPELLVRLLRVLGPVDVPGYDDTITAGNLIERLDFHTHREDVIDDPGRKEFLAALAEVVLDGLLDAPASQWEGLIRAVGDAFDVREAMAWTAEAGVNRELTRRGWDGAPPDALGDFVHLTEFAYTTKAGRGWQRTFDHRVSIRPDGSAHITTTVTIANTLPPSDTGKINIDTLSYITVHGPEGAVPVWERSDAALDLTGPLRGRWGIGLVRAAPPLGEVSFTVAWDAPRIALERVDGRYEYRLTWLHLPGRDDDVLHLAVELPDGWRWAGDEPPGVVENGRQDFRGAWVIVGD